MDNSIWWIGFNLLILILLYLDLKIFNKKDKVISVKAASLWALFWFSLAMLFNLFIYFQFDSKAATEFFTGYILELSLSVDNLFVFVVIFNFFETEPKYQHRVLFWGILGAIIMRAIMIIIGTALLAKFTWIEYFFGGFLIITAIKMLGDDDDSDNLEENILVKFLHKYFPVTSEYHQEKFVVKLQGKKIDLLR